MNASTNSISMKTHDRIIMEKVILDGGLNELVSDETSRAIFSGGFNMP